MGRKLARITGYVSQALAPPGRAASAWVSRRLNGTLEIRALRGSLFASLLLLDVVLRDRQGTEVVRVDAIDSWYDLTALLTRRLVVQRVDIGRLQGALVQEPGGVWNINRVLARPPAPDGAIGGQLPVAIMAVELRLETRGMTLIPGLTARLKGELTGNTVRLDDVQVRSAVVSWMARGTLSTTAKTALTYDMKRDDLAPLQGYLGGHWQAKGSLSGTLQGTWPALQVRSRLQLREWRYGALHGQRGQVELAVVQFPTAPQVTIKTQVSDVQGPNLPRSAGTLSGTLTPAQGTVQVSVTAGPYHKSGFEGRVTFAAEQRLTLSHLRLQHAGGQVKTLAWENAGPITVVRHPQGTLEIQPLSLRSAGQEIRLQGILLPRGAFEVEVHVHHLQILPHVRAVAPDVGIVDGVVAFHLRLHDTLAQPQGEGTLHVTSLRWQQHALGEVHSEFHVHGTAVGIDLHWHDQQQKLLHLYGDVSCDTRQALALHLLASVDLPRNVWVRGPGTAVEIRGAVTLTKALGEPFRLAGTVETVRGFTSFYNGKFALEQGRVTFTGSPEINPVLDVTVTREVVGHVVAINVAGRATSPQLHLSSTPDLPQADIVTLLVVGKTSDRLTASERSGLSGQAQQIVGHVAAGALEQLVTKPLGLDTVDLQTGEKLGSGKVSIGRYITQDIFLSYERQLGAEEGNKVGIEYSVNRHLKLKGSSSDIGASALDILWRIDY